NDPVGQFHRYRYANSNPYRFNDPDGRIGHIVAGGAIGGIIGGAVELYKQSKTGDYDMGRLATETGKGIAVGAATAAVPVGIAAGVLNFGSKAANVAAVAGTATAAGAGGEAIAQQVSGDGFDATEAAVAGGLNLGGLAFGATLAAPARALTTVTTPAI